MSKISKTLRELLIDLRNYYFSCNPILLVMWGSLQISQEIALLGINGRIERFFRTIKTEVFKRVEIEEVPHANRLRSKYQ